MGFLALVKIQILTYFFFSISILLKRNFKKSKLYVSFGHHKKKKKNYFYYCFKRITMETVFIKLFWQKMVIIVAEILKFFKINH